MMRAHALFRLSRGAIGTLIAISFLAFCGPVDADASEFVAGSEDIPLMPGLTAVADAGLVFDSPAGRVVESVYESVGDGNAVRAFYSETLPALGWRVLSDDRFEREGEVLEIDFFGNGGGLTVRFTLAPI